MSIGYFNEKEYVITDMKPRRRLYNYLWNEQCVCQCDQFGNGYSWRSVGTQRRNIESGDRNVYIRDNESGETYSANRNYFDLPFDMHECHVGLGYQTIISEYKGIKTEFTVLVPIEDAVTLFRLKVKNTGKKERNLSLFFSVSPQPALSWHESYGFGDFSARLNGLLFTHDGFALPNDYTKLFVSSDKAFDGFEVSHQRFCGEYSGFYEPAALKQKKLSSKGWTFGGYVAVFEFDVKLRPEGEYEVCFCAAAAKNENECASIKDKYLAAGAFEEEKKKQYGYNEKYLDVFTLDSPDKYLNEQVNVWLKRQLSLGKTWGRLYGKGFRDVMQDITAFVSFDTGLARKRILYALAYQYEDGNPIRMFEPNFRYPYNDGGVWITGAVLSYLNESGDLTILDEEISYLKGDSYENASTAEGYYEQPYVAGKRKDSVLEHIGAAIDYLVGCRGKNDLVLWRGGDWNDSMNNVGLKNVGESVWLSIATIKAINEYIEILKLAGKTDRITYYETARNGLKNAVEKRGKCGYHFIYGINDDGETIGGAERMFLNPQSWAVLGEVSDKRTLERAMDEAEQKLKCKFGYVQCSPSYYKGAENIGRVSYFQPGLVENGAVYNHGVAFKIVADCMLGRGDNAYRTLKLISYDNPNNRDNGVEPYAVSNMYVGPENPYLAGYAPMSWITGTAGWLYRAITEYICGIKATPHGLKLEPCLPTGWSKIRITRKFRGALYNVEIIRSDEKGLWLNGKKSDGNVLPVIDSGNSLNCVLYI
ncbi:MAG: hypothetical protein J6T42_03625 [Clostridia bacterium]|nr:hypothetical protein [Clostridia bacterium]